MYCDDGTIGTGPGGTGGCIRGLYIDAVGGYIGRTGDVVVGIGGGGGDENVVGGYIGG